MNTNDKTVLNGGRLGEIYRQNDAVLRPAKPWTVAVQRFLRFMCDEGADFVPVPLGINEKNEEMLSYMPGTVYNYPLPAVMLTDNMIISAARLLRTFHDRSMAYLSRLTGAESWMLPIPTGSVEVMCHGDFAPYNITVLNGEANGIIDFDTLHPGARLWDAAYAAYRFAPLTTADDAVVTAAVVASNEDTAILNKASTAGVDATVVLRRAGLFLDAYGLTQEERKAFVPVLTARLRALVLFMQTKAQQGDKTFQQHITEGHLTLYQNDIAWLDAHTDEIACEVARITGKADAAHA